MVFVSVILICTVTLKTERITFCNGFCAVNVMAVAAFNITVIHLALGKGPEYIDFLQYLAVRKIELRGDQAWKKAVQKVRFGMGIIPKYGASAVTWSAQIPQPLS